MKKFFHILLCAVLIINLSTGCSSSRDTGLPTITLALRDGIYSNVISTCVKDFEEQKHVHCQIFKLSEEELHALVSGDAGNKTGKYDLCMVDGSWMAEYTNQGFLANLNELGYELDDDIIPATTKICYFAGNLYLAPYYGNVTVLLYNRIITSRTGHTPEDMDCMKSLLKICRKATKKGHLGFMYRADTPNNLVVDFLPILSSFGGWVVDDKNRPTVNTPEFKRAMNFYLKLIATGKAETRDNLVIAIANNAATMAVGWPGWYTPSDKSTADYCAFTGKAGKNSPAYNANVYGIWTLGIPKNSANKTLAAELLSYLMDKKVQKKTVFYGGVPCRYSSLQDHKIQKSFPEYKAVCNALENGIYRPILVEWPKFYEILGEEMYHIITEKKSVNKGLADAQKRLEAELG